MPCRSRMRQAVAATLRASGYTNLKVFQNGGQAWEWINSRFRQTGDLSQVADLLISDVEMPQMDGFHLTRRIKEHPQLKRLPVLLYSSIVSPDNHKKGRAVGADAQISKPDLAKVVELVTKARQHPARSQRLIDRIGPTYSVCVILGSVAVSVTAGVCSGSIISLAARFDCAVTMACA